MAYTRNSTTSIHRGGWKNDVAAFLLHYIHTTVFQLPLIKVHAF